MVPKPNKPQLELDQVGVTLGDTPVVQQVSFSLGEGDIGCLLGPSGCGKTTLLRTIAGFQAPSEGRVHIAGEVMATPTQQTSPEHRRIGMVFQDLALFPHMNVRRNVAFGMKGMKKSAINERVDELLELVGLQSFANSYPHQLSGGQQQRVALIRAMAPRPIGVIKDGRLCQWDNAYDLYHKPQDRFVADFIGEGVFVCGNTLENNRIQTELGIIEGELSNRYDVGTQIELLVRPDDLRHDETSPTRATVIAKDFRGADHLYTLRMPGSTRLLCLAPSHLNHDVGEQFGVRLQLDHLMIFEQQRS